MADATAARIEGGFSLAGAAAPPGEPFAWTVETVAPGVGRSRISPGSAATQDWFFRHFDHAAATVVSYMLADSPKLKGRILDVGCGDGITALGVALRTGCEELVAIDPFRGFDRLPEILARQPPARRHDPEAREVPRRGRELPAFRRRQLRRGGLVGGGGALRRRLPAGDARDEAGAEARRPALHPPGPLLLQRRAPPRGVLAASPSSTCASRASRSARSCSPAKARYEDRAGETPTPAQHWQWFNELNPITVTRFEQELRALEFEPWRVAIRTEGLVEYTPETLAYPMQDLATNELYVSCVNRKKRR